MGMSALLTSSLAAVPDSATPVTISANYASVSDSNNDSADNSFSLTAYSAANNAIANEGNGQNQHAENTAVSNLVSAEDDTTTAANDITPTENTATIADLISQQDPALTTLFITDLTAESNSEPTTTTTNSGTSETSSEKPAALPSQAQSALTISTPPTPSVVEQTASIAQLPAESITSHTTTVLPNNAMPDIQSSPDTSSATDEADTLTPSSLFNFNMTATVSAQNKTTSSNNKAARQPESSNLTNITANDTANVISTALQSPTTVSNSISPQQNISNAAISSSDITLSSYHVTSTSSEPDQPQDDNTLTADPSTLIGSNHTATTNFAALLTSSAVKQTSNTSNVQLGQQMLQTLKDQVQQQISQNLKQVTIRLDPPSLGHLNITIDLTNDHLNVQINASHDGLRQALEQNKQALSQVLAMENSGSVDVNVGQESSADQQTQAQWTDETSILSNAQPAATENRSDQTTRSQYDWLNTVV
jgi:flagellar hook-length control protein FliK